MHQLNGKKSAHRIAHDIGGLNAKHVQHGNDIRGHQAFFVSRNGMGLCRLAMPAAIHRDEHDDPRAQVSGTSSCSSR